MKPTVHSSEYVHENPWYKVRHDKLTWLNGKPGNYFVAEFPGAICVIAIDQERLLTVRQYRHPIDLETIEVPMGSLRKDEEPLEGAKRELREEAGLVAASWKKLGLFYCLDGVVRMPMHVFLAQDFSETKTELDDSEEDLKTEWIPMGEWEKMIREGEVVDAETLAAWLLYKSQEKELG